MSPVVVFNKLCETNCLNFKRDTVVIRSKFCSEEDMPNNTAFVFIRSTVDVPSRISGRARNEHHVHFTCSEYDKLA